MTRPRFFFPINLNDTHWVAGVVDFLMKTITIYDSMAGNLHAERREKLLQVV